MPNQQSLEADYLVIGSGAMGMAFTDVILNETKANVIMVDRHHQPGGHWNDAYPYVRLHQPSAFYGVNSKALGSNTIDAVGWNKGLFELATNSEVVAYFDQVMHQQFLPSGRVQYFPNCEYEGEGDFHSLLSNAQYRVKAKKIVDATYMNVTVPSMQPPKFKVADDAYVEPPNSLPKLQHKFNNYVVVGAGKTAMDACLFLLKNEVDPQQIQWVMPRDSWIFNRAFIQPGAQFAQAIGENQAAQIKATIEATSVDDLLDRVEATGFIMRFDPEVRPTMWRCATVTEDELVQLRRIKNIIRMGRVEEISADTIHLAGGTLTTNPQTLHINCTADGLEQRPVKPVFDENLITLQSVRTCQQVFSAAFIGHIEAAYATDAEKNELCQVVPHPNTNLDFVRCNLLNNLNSGRWSQDKELSHWLAHARLDGFSTPESLNPSPQQTSAEHDPQVLGQKAVAKMQALLAEG